MNSLQRFCQAHQNLEIPYVPFEAALKVDEPEQLGTRSLTTSLYEIDAWVQEFLTKPTGDFWVLGVADGSHGVSSRALHYYASKGPLAVYVQRTFESATHDSEDMIASIQAAFQMIQELFEAAERHPPFSPNKRLLVIDSDLRGKGWGWIDGHPGKIDQASWHQEDHPLALAQDGLDNPPT